MVRERKYLGVRDEITDADGRNIVDVVNGI
jgi:hypothetical protein